MHDQPLRVASVQHGVHGRVYGDGLQLYGVQLLLVGDYLRRRSAVRMVCQFQPWPPEQPP